MSEEYTSTIEQSPIESDAVVSGQGQELEQENGRERSKRLAERILEQRSVVDEILERDREISDDLPFDEYVRRREDQINGKQNEYRSIAREVGREMQAALAQNAMANLQDSLEYDADSQDGYSNLPPLQPADGSGYDLDRMAEERAQELISHRDHLARLESVKEQHPDFEEVARRAVAEVGDIPGPMVEVIRGLENSGEVTYALISKPSTLRRIAEMPVVQAITEIAKISAGLMGAKSDPPTSRAPAPVTPVKKSGPGHAPSIYDEDLPYEDYVKLRNKQKGRSG